MKLPTAHEAQSMFGPGIADDGIPFKHQEVTQSPSGENNAVEMTLQIRSDASLGHEDVGIIDLIGNLACSSVCYQLRAKAQLGYIISACTRKTAGGTWGLTVVAQINSKSPTYLEERIEA